MKKIEKPLILIVDKDQAEAKELAARLEEVAIRTEVTNDTVEALKMVKRKFYNLVIAENAMKKMVGTELIRKIREFDPGLSVIIVTSYLNAYVGMSCQRHGAAGIFKKPYKFERLLDTVIKELRFS